MDALVVMPDHAHGIIPITADDDSTPCSTTARRNPIRSDQQFGRPTSGSVPDSVGAFKSAVTKRSNRLRKTPGAAVWQRSYLERMVRTDRKLRAIRRYIAGNSARWAPDRSNPAGPRCDAYPPRSDDEWHAIMCRRTTTPPAYSTTLRGLESKRARDRIPYRKIRQESRWR